MKPDFWVVLDTLHASDGKPHTYDALFHFDAKLKAEGVRAVTQNEGEANLTMVARPDAGLTLRLVEGQEDPVRGWLPRGLSGVRPAQVGILSAHGVEANLLYVLAPSPRGAGDPIKAVDAVAGDPHGARISFQDGRLYEVHFTGGGAEWKEVR